MSNYSRGEEAQARRKEAGQYIKRSREKTGLTQYELSQRLGYKLYTFVSQVECGARTVPSEHMVEWAKSLGIEPKVFARTLVRYYDPALLMALFYNETDQSVV